MVKPLFNFRLTLHRAAPGFFKTDSLGFGYPLRDGLTLEVYPRDADTLSGASHYHINGGSFETADGAKSAGEHLRTRLRLLNSVFDLGLSIPIDDSTTGKVSSAIKEKLLREHGVTLLDTVSGLIVYPDDGFHAEHVTSSKINVAPSDPLFLFDAIGKFWDIPLEFDDTAADVLNLLNISSVEPTQKLKFLTLYLALEQLITVTRRSDGAQQLLKTFIAATAESDLSEQEKESMTSALANLKNGSFSSAFKAFSRTIRHPEHIQGLRPEQIASRAIALRNGIAHGSESVAREDVALITKGLREIVHGVLWGRYGIPDTSVYRPADSLDLVKFETRIV